MPSLSGESFVPNTEARNQVVDITKRFVVLPKRGQAGNPLVWQDGKLKTILSKPAFEKKICPPIQISKSNILSNANHSSALIPTVKTQGPLMSSENDNENLEHHLQSSKITHLNVKRRKDSLFSLENESDTNSIEMPAVKPVESVPVHLTSRPRTQSRRSARSAALKIPPLLLPAREQYKPTDWALPKLDLSTKNDPLNFLDSDRSATTSTTDEIAEPNNASSLNMANPLTSNSMNVSTATVRMKSSFGIGDIDPEYLRHYRRINGYTLFVLVNKKRYETAIPGGSTDDFIDVGDNQSGKDNQKMTNRRWQALWSTLPEKTRREWKTKAKRLIRQMEQQSKRDLWSETRRVKELSRLEVQFSRSKTTSYNLLDLAAHFQLLSDKFASFAKLVDAYEGPVDTNGALSLLLDGFLTCLIPLLALSAEAEPIADAPDRKTTCDALSNLIHIAPF